ncbi:MAG: hypothetical protein V1752_08195 [Candidatus Firestonebacteria bacterium]
MPAVKICIIGGGSPYMTSMFTSLARFAKKGLLKNSKIVLYDINKKNAGLMTEWGKAASLREKIPLKFSTEDKLEKALTGSDFILSTFRTGGLDGRYLDETIPVKYKEFGIETVGIGGIFMALRCIPEVAYLAGQIRRYCPEAWLINYTNPTNIVTDVSLRAGHERSLGLCDGVFGLKWLVCKLLGIPTTRAGEVEAFVSGVNHCTWALKLFYQGRDMYQGTYLEELIKHADLSASDGYQSETGDKLDEVQVDAIRLYRYYGILPGSVYYTRYYYALRKTLEHHLAPGFQQRSEWLKELGLKKRQEIAEQLRKKRASISAYDVEDSAHGDQAIGALNDIANNTRRLEVVNVRNQGAVPNLPNDSVVETTCVLGSNGALPVAAGPLPLGLQGIVRSVQDAASLTVDAGLTGNRKLVLQAALAHPVHRDLDIIEKVIEDLFEAHKQWLPQFYKKNGA